MTQPPTTVSMLAPVTTLSESSSNIKSIFDAALKSYKKKTKNDLKNHDLFKQLEACDSPAAILAVFQAARFDFSPTASDDRLKNGLFPPLTSLMTFSGALGEGVALVNIDSSVFPPAKLVFAGAGVLLLAAKTVTASQDILVDIFGRYRKLLRPTRESIPRFPLTPGNDGQNGGKSRLRSWISLRQPQRKWHRVERNLKVTYAVDNKVTAVGDGVKGVDEKVQVVKSEVQLVGANVEAIDDKVQTIAEGGRSLFGNSASPLTSII
ncbi:hypothetical protein EDB84DRAFT_1640179 [Lactarius hengduanensis]|nr:hypothetical protein EDB84DRAFT_1640179 [Lactarius hengduanensis]